MHGKNIINRASVNFTIKSPAGSSASDKKPLLPRFMWHFVQVIEWANLYIVTSPCLTKLCGFTDGERHLITASVNEIFSLSGTLLEHLPQLWSCQQAEENCAPELSNSGSPCSNPQWMREMRKNLWNGRSQGWKFLMYYKNQTYFHQKGKNVTENNW